MNFRKNGARKMGAMWRNVILSAVILGLSGCETRTEVTHNMGMDTQVSEAPEKIVLVDQQGKAWDITHAVNAYGMKPDYFQFGLGIGAIPPILNPEMIAPNDSGYPGDEEFFLVIGAELGGDARAYPLKAMSRHEVVDEQFGGAHVAVAY